MRQDSQVTGWTDDRFVLRDFSGGVNLGPCWPYQEKLHPPPPNLVITTYHVPHDSILARYSISQHLHASVPGNKIRRTNGEEEE